MIIAFLISFAFLLWAAVKRFKLYRIRDKIKTVKGHITSIRRAAHIIEFSIAYDVDSIHIVVNSKSYGKLSSMVGDEVMVRYNVNNPSEPLDHEFQGTRLIFYAGILFFTLTLITYIVSAA